MEVKKTCIKIPSNRYNEVGTLSVALPSRCVSRWPSTSQPYCRAARLWKKKTYSRLFWLFIQHASPKKTFCFWEHWNFALKKIHKMVITKMLKSKIMYRIVSSCSALSIKHLRKKDGKLDYITFVVVWRGKSKSKSRSKFRLTAQPYPTGICSVTLEYVFFGQGWDTRDSLKCVCVYRML